MHVLCILMQAIQKWKSNKALAADGIHIEVFKTEPKACAEVLETWW